eukprot:scaffold40333_cov28-Prasinocladus_malaysianus.AAC.1
MPEEGLEDEGDFFQLRRAEGLRGDVEGRKHSGQQVQQSGLVQPAQAVVHPDAGALRPTRPPRAKLRVNPSCPSLDDHITTCAGTTTHENA